MWKNLKCIQQSTSKQEALVWQILKSSRIDCYNLSLSCHKPIMKSICLVLLLSLLILLTSLVSFKSLELSFYLLSLDLIYLPDNLEKSLCLASFDALGVLILSIHLYSGSSLTTSSSTNPCIICSLYPLGTSAAEMKHQQYFKFIHGST